MSGRRPVNAAIPHWSASGAWAVYQAWWARWKLPTPECTIRIGAAAGLPGRERDNRAGSVLSHRWCFSMMLFTA